jgi:hypothetical protein
MTNYSFAFPFIFLLPITYPNENMQKYEKLRQELHIRMIETLIRKLCSM